MLIYHLGSFKGTHDLRNLQMVYCEYLVGGLVAIFGMFPLILGLFGFRFSSQLTKSYFSEGWLNHQPVYVDRKIWCQCQQTWWNCGEELLMLSTRWYQDEDIWRRVFWHFFTQCGFKTSKNMLRVAASTLFVKMLKPSKKIGTYLEKGKLSSPSLLLY